MDDPHGCPPPPPWVTIDYGKVAQRMGASAPAPPPEIDDAELDRDLDLLDAEPDVTGSGSSTAREAAPRVAAPAAAPPDLSDLVDRVPYGTQEAGIAFLRRLEAQGARPPTIPPVERPVETAAPRPLSRTDGAALTAEDRERIAMIEARLKDADANLLLCGQFDDAATAGEFVEDAATEAPPPPRAAEAGRLPPRPPNG